METKQVLTRNLKKVTLYSQNGYFDYLAYNYKTRKPLIEVC